MASKTQSASGLTAQVIGDAFVSQYFTVLQKSPVHLFQFYQERSKVDRPDSTGTMSSVTTIQAIKEKLLSLCYDESKVEIKTVDAQHSLNGVIVLVTGCLTYEDKVGRDFTQSFFLAPQEKGHFVLNDIFRYVEISKHRDLNENLANGVAANPVLEQVPASSKEPQATEQPASLPEKVDVKEETPEAVVAPKSTLVAPKPSLVAPKPTPVAPKPTPVAPKPTPVPAEDAPKMSYASIVKVMVENPAPLAAPKTTQVRAAPKKQERQIPSATHPVRSANPPVSGSNGTAENGSALVREAEGFSIYIRNLPLNAIASQLEEEFKKFGPIKTNGIQVRSNMQEGFCIGFVEFEAESAMKSAIDASPIMIGGREAYVRQKRPRSRGDDKGRFLARRAGFKNEGARIQGGNYGGRVDSSIKTGGSGGGSKGGATKSVA